MTPTVEVQRDALSKGLGRALKWARDGKLDEEVLLDACLENLVFDIQVDDTRGDWLWNAIVTCGLTERFRKPILKALDTLSNFRDSIQLCEIAVKYAQTGDTEFRNVLRRIAIRQPLGLETPSDAEDAVLEFDGQEGFLKLASVYGKRSMHIWEWHAIRLIESAEERFGEEAVRAAISKSRHSDIVRFRRKLKRVNSSRLNRRVRRPYESFSADEVIEQSKKTRGGFLLQKQWGKKASDQDLQAVARATMAEQDPKVLARLLKVFISRDWPEDVEYLAGFCNHADRRVNEIAWLAANRISHPAVRALAIEGAKAGFPAPRAIGAFASNYVAGDENTILDAIALSEFETVNHALFQESLDVLKFNAVTDPTRLALAAYRYSPCSYCRSHAVDRLVERNLAPAWLLEECRDDANGLCRKAVEPDSDDESPESDADLPG